MTRRSIFHCRGALQGDLSRIPFRGNFMRCSHPSPNMSLTLQLLRTCASARNDLRTFFFSRNGWCFKDPGAARMFLNSFTGDPVTTGTLHEIRRLHLDIDHNGYAAWRTMFTRIAAELTGVNYLSLRLFCPRTSQRPTEDLPSIYLTLHGVQQMIMSLVIPSISTFEIEIITRRPSRRGPIRALHSPCSPEEQNK